MPRIFRIGSITAHVVVVAAVFVAQLLATGPLPVPRSPLTFVGAIPIAIVEPPAAPRVKPSQRASSVASARNAAPVVSPDGVAPEPPAAAATPPAGTGFVEGGVPGLEVLAPLVAVTPPAPPPAPPPPSRLHRGMQPPRKIVNVDPIYPRVAQITHVDGVVILEATIDAQGRVTAARVLRSIPLLDQAAIDAVQQWRFTPALLDGEAVPVVMTVTVNFKLMPER